MEKTIGLSFKNMELKEKLWGMLSAQKSPSVINAFTGEIGFIMPYMKVSIEEGELYAVYTDSNLYPDITTDDLKIITDIGVVDGVRHVSYGRAWTKLRALREQLLLNRARGAFKKEQEKIEEITRLLGTMRKLKYTKNIFLNT